jgi:hypothetical protein
MSSWEEAKQYVELVVREIDQPHATLLRLEVVLSGDGQERVWSDFGYEGATPEQMAALLRHASTLVHQAADRALRRNDQ